MNYSKPEVKTLGQAKAVIEGQGKQLTTGSDPNVRLFIPTYDLDE